MPPATAQRSSPCERCGRPSAEAFSLNTPEGPVAACLACTLRDRGILLRSVVTSMVVGTILLAINQGDVILSGAWPASLAWKVPLTYAVPFAVCTWGALTTARRRE